MVLLYSGVWYTENYGWHPTQGLLDAATYVQKIGVVFDCWKTIRADHPVHFRLDPFLYVGPYYQGEDETVQCCCRRVGPCFQ